MNKYNVTGYEIVALLGVSESEDRMLDLFEKLGLDKNEFERDEDDGAFFIDFEEELGLELEFSDAVPKELKNPQHIGGQYLVCIWFYYNFNPLPYTLDDKDSLAIIEKKLGKKANYIDTDDKERLNWMYEDLGWFAIIFEDETYDEINTIQINLYRDPEDEEMQEIMKPFKR